MASVTVGESSTSIAISKSITPRYATSCTQSSTVAGAVERSDSGIGDRMIAITRLEGRREKERAVSKNGLMMIAAR